MADGEAEMGEVEAEDGDGWISIAREKGGLRRVTCRGLFGGSQCMYLIKERSSLEGGGGKGGRCVKETGL